MKEKEKKIKVKVKYYLEVPYVYREHIQRMYNIKWDRDEKKWFTNEEWEVQHIDKKLDELRSLERDNIVTNKKFLMEQIEKIVFLIHPSANEDEKILFKDKLIRKNYDIDLIFPGLEIYSTNYKLSREFKEIDKLFKKQKLKLVK